MSRTLITFASLLLSGTSAVAQESTGTLKATELRRLTAFSHGDVDAILDIEGGAQGFGHSSPFRPVRAVERQRLILSRWFAQWDDFKIRIEDATYRVVGGVGLVTGTLVRNEDPKQGATVERRIRYSATYIRRDGKWKMVQYHRSHFPNSLGP